MKVKRRQVRCRADVQPCKCTEWAERFEKQLECCVSSSQVINLKTQTNQVTSEIEDEEMATSESLPSRRIKRIVRQTKHEDASIFRFK